MALFTLAGVVAAVIVGVATEIASRRVGEREAIADARTKRWCSRRAASNRS